MYEVYEPENFIRSRGLLVKLTRSPLSCLKGADLLALCDSLIRILLPSFHYSRVVVVQPT